VRRIGQQGCVPAGGHRMTCCKRLRYARTLLRAPAVPRVFRPFGELKKDVGPTEGSFTDHAADDAVAGISGRVARVIILSGVNDDCGTAGLKH
jgi:hypothetical protein